MEVKPKTPSRAKWGRPLSSGAFPDTARQHRLSALYRLAACTGARRGEPLNLRWRNVDLDHGEVRITGSAAVIARPEQGQPCLAMNPRLTVAQLSRHRVDVSPPNASGLPLCCSRAVLRYLAIAKIGGAAYGPA